jgi:hypothetical protein
MNWSDFFRESALQDLQLGPVLLSLALSLILGQVLAWHYQRFSPVLSHKRKFARMFVFLVTTTMLVITVVKTSLALSLGLVGALSIIRFRTPIKEPEDLAYLFLAVAVGIGLGADQRLLTTTVFAVFLVYLSFTRAGSAAGIPARLLVHVTSVLEGREGTPRNVEEALQALLAQAKVGAEQVDLRRVDMQGNEFNASLILDVAGSDAIGALVRRIQDALPAATVSVVEGSTLD